MQDPVGFVLEDLLLSLGYVAVERSLPVPAMVRNASAITFGEVATQKPANHRACDAKDHEGYARHDVACEVGKEKQANSGVHQDRQCNSQDALRHGFGPFSTSAAEPENGLCFRLDSAFDHLAGGEIILANPAVPHIIPRPKDKSLCFPHFWRKKESFQGKYDKFFIELARLELTRDDAHRQDGAKDSA